MLKFLGVFGAVFAFLFLLTPIVVAQSNFVPAKEEFEKAQVIDITKQGIVESGGYKLKYQDLKLKIIDGSDQGLLIDLTYGGDTYLTDAQLVNKDDVLILDKTQGKFLILDKYRLDPIPFVLIGFAVLLLFVAGWKGLGSIAGLIISLFVILKFIIPQIILGHDPLTVSILGAMVILFVTTYLAHGISKQTTIALISTFIALIFAAFFAIGSVSFTKLAGIGNEDAVSLLMGRSTSTLNLQGLLLAGIIIGTLGALNDITTTQSATIFELKVAAKQLDFYELFSRGLVIGREHIVSLVNTLVLAYAGSSLAIFIYFILNPSQQPLWVLINNEVIIDELIKTLAGTMGLILAIPIVTALASWYVSRKKLPS